MVQRPQTVRPTPTNNVNNKRIVQSTHNRHKPPLNMTNGVQRGELVTRHHGGHLRTPHRAPSRGGFQSRPTLGEASPAMEVTAVDARVGPAALLKKSSMSRTVHYTPRDVPSLGLSSDLPLLDLKN
jgi:hypothetical protein